MHSGETMKIANEMFVSIDYTIKDEAGAIVDSTDGKQPLSYIHGTGVLLEGLENALEGKGAGESLNVKIPPEKAFGVRDDSLIQKIPRGEFAAISDLKTGMQLQARTERGVQIFTVQEITEEMVTVDGNHPLAGQTLDFNVQIGEVRMATEEELNPRGGGCCGGGHHGHGGSCQNEEKEEDHACCGGQGHGHGGGCGHH